MNIIADSTTKTQESVAAQTSASVANPQESKSSARTFFSQLWKYCGVSFTQTFVELGVFLLMKFIGLQPGIANIFAIIASGSYNFAMNRNITFKSSSNFTRSVIMFILLYTWNLLFCNVMLAVLPGLIGWSPEIIKLFTMGCQGVWGFLLCKYVIFK